MNIKTVSQQKCSQSKKEKKLNKLKMRNYKMFKIFDSGLKIKNKNTEK